MRTLASQLSSMAREVGQAGDQMHSRATKLEFEGPAARRFRTWAEDERKQASITRDKLNEIAQYLRREADALQQALAAAPPKGRGR